jgi:tetratricopeptide (TPR) repeat protein
LVLLTVLPPLVIAEGPLKVGQMVITKYATPVKDGEDRIVDDNKSLVVYEVKEIVGRRARLDSRAARGWADLDRIIPLDQAIDFYTSELQKDPKNSTAYLRRGLVWFEKKNLEKAIADFDGVIRLDPENHLALVNRGFAWAEKGDLDRAIGDLTTLLKHYPEDAVSYWARGGWLETKGEYERAIEDLNVSIRLYPVFAAAYRTRGVAHMNSWQYEKAFADFAEAIRLDPNDAKAVRFRGTAFSNTNEYDKAVADFRQAIRLDPKYADARASLAWLLATCPDPKFRNGVEAIESATRACELSGWENADHLDSLASAYAETGNFKKAIELQEKADPLYKQSDAKRYGRARLELYKKGKPYRQGMFAPERVFDA